MPSKVDLSNRKLTLFLKNVSNTQIAQFRQHLATLPKDISSNDLSFFDMLINNHPDYSEINTLHLSNHFGVKTYQNKLKKVLHKLMDNLTSWLVQDEFANDTQLQEKERTQPLIPTPLSAHF